MTSLLALIMIFHFGNRQKLKEGMSLGYLSIVAFHAAKVPTNVFSSKLICCLTLDYYKILIFDVSLDMNGHIRQKVKKSRTR